LKWARQEKERREREAAFKEAGIDPANIKINEVEENIPDIDLDAKLASRLVKRNNIKRWIIYPEDA
jgi:hypothetical protein